MKTPLNTQQAAIVAEFCTAYAIEPDDITFFANDPQVPFFGYMASCILLNKLTDVEQIELEPVASISPDSISRRCRLVFPNGSSSFIAAANINETDDDGKPLSTQQLEWLADSRAIRGAIRAKGLNLLRLHWDSKGEKKEEPVGKAGNTANWTEAPSPFASEYQLYVNMARNAHALGEESGLIKGDNKSLWYQALESRYGAKQVSDLNPAEMQDFIAFMQALRPRAKAAS